MAEKANILILKGPLTVDRASSFRDEIMSQIKNTDEVSLDFSAATSIDLSFVQLLYAASRETHKLGKKLIFQGSLSPDIRKTLETGGFGHAVAEPADELESALFDFSPPVSEVRQRG